MKFVIPIEVTIVVTLGMFFVIRVLISRNRLHRRIHEMKSILYDVFSHSRPDELITLYERYTRKKNFCPIRFQSSVNYSVFRNLSEQRDYQQFVRLMKSYQKVGEHTPILKPMIKAAIKNLDREWLQSILRTDGQRGSVLKSNDMLSFLSFFDLKDHHSFALS